jgi:hypothetical protein
MSIKINEIDFTKKECFTKGKITNIVDNRITTGLVLFHLTDETGTVDCYIDHDAIGFIETEQFDTRILPHLFEKNDLSVWVKIQDSKLQILEIEKVTTKSF